MADSAPPEAGSGGRHDLMNTTHFTPLTTISTGSDYIVTSGNIHEETVPEKVGTTKFGASATIVAK